MPSESKPLGNRGIIRMSILYHGRGTGKDKQGKKIWTRIGAVWPNKSGNGFNLTWDYLPLGDGLTVMLPFEKEGGEISPPEV